MRTPEQLIAEFNADLDKNPLDTITQYASVNGMEHWPELNDLEFRKVLEVKMYENSNIHQVYFTAPTEELGWAVFVVPHTVQK